MNAQPRMKKLAWTMDSWEQPAKNLGGDFVVCTRSTQTLRVFLGDVTGHDSEAAATARRISKIIRTDLEHEIDESTLRRWSSASRIIDGDRFVAFSYVEIDIATGHGTIAAAGNPPTIVARDHFETFESVMPDGMPLGLVDDDEWVPPTLRRIKLDAGDSVICFTDGMTDIRVDDTRSTYGVARILAALARTAPQAAVNTLRNNYTAFPARDQRHDDVTVLSVNAVLKRAA